MKDVQDREMFLTPDAEIVSARLVALGARPTCGYRDLDHQCHAMAENVCKPGHKDWIGRTYLHGQRLQELVNEHPEWTDPEEMAREFAEFLGDHPEILQLLSHHLLGPCPCVDFDPTSINDDVKEAIAGYKREGIIKVVLWEEGGIKKCHIEVATLPNNKLEVIHG